MSSLPNPSPEELLTALLDEQLSGEEKERAERLAASDYRELWESLLEQKQLLRELPRFRLRESFADETMAALQAQQSAAAGSFPNRRPDAMGRWESTTAIGAVVGLAAVILCLLVVLPPVSPPSLGLAGTDSNQESKLAGAAATNEAGRNEGSSDAAARNSGADSEQMTSPQARMASIQNQAASTMEVWLLDVAVRDGLSSIGDALTRHGVEWSASGENNSAQPYQALLVRTTALRLKQTLGELADDQSITGVWKVPVSGMTLSREDQGEANRGEPLQIQKLEYQVGGAEQSEAEQRRQIRALNDWFGLDPELVDEAQELRQQTYLLMLRTNRTD